MPVPKKVDQRIIQGVQKYRPILTEARNRDVNEADTVTICKGILGDVFGWDPFFEVTAEYTIRGTYVDLAVKADDQIGYLIEVKAIGSDLKDIHLRQAINYAANQGIEWVVLTNAAVWQAHRVTFAKPISHEMVFQLDFLNDNPRDQRFRETAFLLTKEGMTKSAIASFHAEQQAMSRFNISAILRSEAVLSVVRRELRRAYPKLSPTVDQLQGIVEAEVLKREVVEGEKATAALKAIQKANNRALRKRAKQEPKPVPAGGANGV